MRIEELGMSVKTTQALINNNVLTLEDLQNTTENDVIYNFKNFGRASLNELLCKMKEMRISFKTEEPVTVFKDTEFEMTKAYRDLRNQIDKVLEGRFSNADSIRSLEDDAQLALKLWNLPKFDSCEELYEWLCKEHIYEK